MAGMSDEDYWDSSQTKAFNFEDEVITQKYNPSRLAQVQNKPKLNTSLPTINKIPLLPVYDIITEKNLNKYIGNDKINKESHKLSKLKIEEIVNNIILGKPFDLKCFNTLHHKIKFLDAAIASKDGNCILTAVLLLVKTLKSSLVVSILKTRPVALDHYIDYLTTRFNTSLLSELSVLKGYNSIIGLKLLKILFIYFSSKENLESFGKKLKTLNNQWFENTGVTDENDNKSIIKNYIDLIDWHTQVLGHKDINNKKDFSTNYCLQLYCPKYWDVPEHSCNPQVIAKRHQMTNRQLQWILLNIKIFEKSWNDIMKTFIKTNWFGNKKVINSVIDAENIIIQLGENQAPPELLEHFLRMMDDPKRSSFLARKFKCQC